MNIKNIAPFLLLIAMPSVLFAARPSINELNTRVNQLEAENTQQDIQITNNTNDIDANAINIGINDAAIQANTAAVSGIPKTYYVVDAANQKIGRLINSQVTYYTLINTKGYTVRVYSSGEHLMNNALVLYESSDCTGQAYMRTNELNGTMVVSAENEAMYIPLDAQEVTIQLQSYLYDLGGVGTCFIDPTSNYEAIPIYPNDPAVTGVPNEGYMGRLTVQLL